MIQKTKTFKGLAVILTASVMLSGLAVGANFYTASAEESAETYCSVTTDDRDLSIGGSAVISQDRLAPDGDGKVIVVSYSSLVENIKTAFGGDVVFSFNGTPTYILNAYDASGNSLGSNSFTL